MVRKYKRKPGRVNPDKRMARAVELHAGGLSLKQTAERLACSVRTVCYDLARWKGQHANIVPLCKTGMQNMPHGGEECTAELHSEPSNVVGINDRRKRA